MGCLTNEEKDGVSSNPVNPNIPMKVHVNQTGVIYCARSIKKLFISHLPVSDFLCSKVGFTTDLMVGIFIKTFVFSNIPQ